MNKGGKILAASVGAMLTLTAMAGCSSTSDSPAASGDAKNVKIVTTTSILGSIVDQVAKCGGAQSTTLMGPGTDPHDFKPSSAQVAEMTKATLVIANGFNLEGGMTDVLDNVKKDGAKVYEVAPNVDPIAMEEHGHEHEGEHSDEHSASPSASSSSAPSPSGSESKHDDDHSASPSGSPASATPASATSSPAGSPSASESKHDEHDHGDKDPHFWHDAARAAKAAENIGNELKAKTGNDKFASCGATLKDDLTKLDGELKQTYAAVPKEKRILITDHDALGYLAHAYDFEVAGVVIPGGGTSGEPSSADIKELVEVIKEEGVPAIFSNTAVNSKLVDTVAKETGKQIKVIPLNVDAIGDKNSGADTYQNLMRANAKKIADALK